MEPHRVLQETAYPSLAYGLFGLGRFLQQIPDSYKRVIFMSICGSIWLSLDKTRHTIGRINAADSALPTTGTGSHAPQRSRLHLYGRQFQGSSQSNGTDA